jgi:hypothetical protein
MGTTNEGATRGGASQARGTRTWARKVGATNEQRGGNEQQGDERTAGGGGTGLARRGERGRGHEKWEQPTNNRAGTNSRGTNEQREGEGLAYITHETDPKQRDVVSYLFFSLSTNVIYYSF